MVKKSNWLLIIMSLLVIVGIGGSLAYYHFFTKNSAHLRDEMQALTLFSQPRVFPACTLTDDKKTVFTNQELQGHWTLMFFGFTHCGGVCPTTLAEITKIMHTFPVTDKRLQVIFVTIDPEYDTPEVLRAYLNSFDSSFIGLTGEVASLSRLRKQLGILALERDLNQRGVNDLDRIDHSGTILLINPHGEYVGVFSLPHDTSTIVHDLARLIPK